MENSILQRQEAEKRSAGNSAVHLAKMVGNQAVVQRMWDGDSDWTPGPKEKAQEQEDLLLPEELYNWRTQYGGLKKTKYEDFKKQHYNEGCSHPKCLRVKQGETKYFVDGDKQWKFSIDHITSVASHWKDGGSAMLFANRKAWYNDETNWQPMHLACNSSKNS